VGVFVSVELPLACAALFLLMANPVLFAGARTEFGCRTILQGPRLDPLRSYRRRGGAGRRPQQPLGKGAGRRAAVRARLCNARASARRAAASEGRNPVGRSRTRAR